MAKLIIASPKNAVAEFTNGRVSASIMPLPRGKYAYSIRTSSLQGVNAAGLLDYVDAVRKVCKHIGKQIRKEVSLSGTTIDPNEPTLDLSKDLTVEYQIFKSDKTIKLRFVRHAEDGQVAAFLQAFNFSDIPSAVQVAHVCMKAAGLMKKYSELGSGE